jgi:hemerythrin-like metal-binding protein
MPIFSWNDRLMTHISEIDTQHRSLIDLINKLHDAIDEGRDKEVLGVVLAELVDYTVYHFATEEKYMDAYIYPAAAAHKHEHELLRKKVLTLQQQFDAGQPVVTIEVMKFLKKWLMTHIVAIDKELGTFLDTKGVK